MTSLLTSWGPDPLYRFCLAIQNYVNCSTEQMSGLRVLEITLCNSSIELYECDSKRIPCFPKLQLRDFDGESALKRCFRQLWFSGAVRVSCCEVFLHPCCVTREQLLSHVGVGRRPILAVVCDDRAWCWCRVLPAGWRFTGCASAPCELVVVHLPVVAACVITGQVLRARRFNRPLLFTECVIVKQYFRCDAVWVLCVCTLMTLNNSRYYQRALAWTFPSSLSSSVYSHFIFIIVLHLCTILFVLTFWPETVHTHPRHVTMSSDQRRKRTVICRIFGIRGRTADLLWTLHRQNLNK